MIIFLHGTDTFRSRTQLRKMIEKFKIDRDPQGLNVVSLDCTLLEDGVVLEQMMSIPFLAEKRMVVLENLLSATGKGDLQEKILKRIEEKKIPEENICVFWEGDSKPKTKVGKDLLARLLTEKYAQEFDELKGVKFGAWVATEVTDRGGKINQPAINFLVNNIGGDMWRANSLIDQLIAYKEDEEIDQEAVALFVDEKIDDNIFNLVDSIVGRQTKQIFKMIREQYRVGKDPHYIFAMILRQFRILLEMRDLFEREENMPSDLMAKKLGLHPFVVKKSLPFIKKYNLEDLKKIYSKLLDLDVKFKTSAGDPSLLLDVFVGTL